MKVSLECEKIWVRKEIDILYDMIQGCMNRICVTDDMEERLRCAEFITIHTQELVELTQCRSNHYSNVSEIYKKYRQVSVGLELKKVEEN